MREKEIKGIRKKQNMFPWLQDFQKLYNYRNRKGIQILPFPTAPHRLTPTKLETPILVYLHVGGHRGVLSQLSNSNF